MERINRWFYKYRNCVVGMTGTFWDKGLSDSKAGYNGMIYSVNAGQLIENSFERLGKIIHCSKSVCGISSSFKIFRGVIVQDIFMKCYLACVNLFQSRASRGLEFLRQCCTLTELR